MILKIHSDAGYNNEPKARSRAGGHFFLGNRTGRTDIHNGAILNPTHILKHVASSAAEAEIGAAFVNFKEAIPIRITLEEMGHPQPPTPVTLDNTTAVGFANQKIKQRRTKAIDMRYYWLQDQDAQKHFNFRWEKGSDNLADYFTKHHPPAHHQQMRSQYVNMCPSFTATSTETLRDHDTYVSPRPLRGCADPGSYQRTYDGHTNPVARPAVTVARLAAAVALPAVTVARLAAAVALQNIAVTWPGECRAPAALHKLIDHYTQPLAHANSKLII
jgi:hypothetical protein